jgi:hypothetical protein
MKLFQDEDSKELVHPILKVLRWIFDLIKQFQDIKNQLSIDLKYCLLPKGYTPMNRCSRGRDRMVVGFTTTYVISAYHNWCCEFESRSIRGVQHCVIKFVSDLRQVGGFLRVVRFPPPIKLTATI